MPRLATSFWYVAAVLATSVGYVGPAYAVSAPRPTCHGQPATLVGDQHVAVLRGTPRADVIVTNGANNVGARGGDDTICVTGRPRPGSLISIDAGAGDDVIDARSQHTRTYFLLRGGADTVWGGTAADSVFAGGSGTDRVWTGTGADTAGIGADARVHLGAGDDRINAYRPNNRAVLDGGAGENYLDVTPAPGGAWTLDNRKGQALVDDAKAFSWTGFTTFDLTNFDDSTSLMFRGSDRDERLLRANRLDGVPVALLLGGGNDHLSLKADLPGTFDGGSGRDTVTIAGARGDRHDHAEVDLGGGTFAATSTSASYASFPIAGMEVLHLRSFVHADVTGSAGDDIVSVVHGCGLEFSGLGGDDRITEVDFDESCGVGASNRVVARGGPGDDDLLGGPTDDDLRGDEGVDTARGAAGSDLCDAETRVECELP
jgi:Ca2+-binding RTX toxin-like protein